MDEEQAVLGFFDKPENLPLGLSVAAQMDEIRTGMNSGFWLGLQQRLDSALHGSEWQTRTTEDRNAADMRVGLQCTLREPQSLCLFPMMEQQFLGGDWRIFYGLMWQTTPAPDQLTLPAVAALKTALAEAGFKSNENFLAWQWTNLHPRRSDFLLRYAAKPEQLLDEVAAIFNELLNDRAGLIADANAALKDTPRSMTVSLDQLRRKRPD
jgi:hypothetical protein